MVVAESLSYGVPVIVGDGTPWKQVDQIGCGRCVRNSPDELAKAIEALNDAPLNEMACAVGMDAERIWVGRGCGEMLATYRN